MYVFNALNTLIVDLILQVLFRHLLSKLFCMVHSGKPLTFLEGRGVDELLLCVSEGEYVVNEALKQLVELFLLITKQGFVNDFAHEFLL